MSRASFLCHLSLTAVAASLLLLPRCAVAEDPSPVSKQVVEVKLWVIEVSNTKLRNLGFDWDHARGDTKLADDSNMLGFLTALEQNNIAYALAKPMIATRSGQKASIDMAPHLKVELTATASADDHVDLAYHIDIANARGSGGRFVSAHSTELKSGVVQLLSQTTTQRTAKGEPNHSTILVFAQATIVK